MSIVSAPAAAPVTPTVSTPVAVPATPPMTAPVTLRIKDPVAAPVYDDEDEDEDEDDDEDEDEDEPTAAPTRNSYVELILSVFGFDGCGFFGRILGLCKPL